MKKTPKWHVVFAVLFSIVMVALDRAPSILKAASDDIETFKAAEREVFRITKDGNIVTSSGVASQTTLWVERFVLLNPARSSDTGVIDSVTNNSYPIVLMTTTVILGAGLANGSTTYIEGEFIVQPAIPRTLSFRVTSASGNVVIKGTDTFGNPVTEILTLPLASSTTFRATANAFAGISSFTINVSCLTDTLNSRTSFYIGISTGFGMPFKLDNSSDVFRLSSAAANVNFAVPASSFSASVKHSVLYISSVIVTGASHFTAQAITRRTVNSAKP